MAEVTLVVRDTLRPHAVAWNGAIWWCRTCQRGWRTGRRRIPDGHCPGEVWKVVIPWPR